MYGWKLAAYLNQAEQDVRVKRALVCLINHHHTA
jgi:hypothetical protein